MHLAKSQSTSNWSNRPLSEKQLRYAAEDIRYLLPLHTILSTKIEQVGRVGWFEDEMSRFNSPEMQAKLEKPLQPYDQAWQKVNGAHKLDPAGLQVLASLAAWRAEKAVQKNRNQGGIVPDRVLVTLAAGQPTSTEELASFRLPKSCERDAEDLVAAVVWGRLMAKKSLGTERELQHRLSSPLIQGGDRALEHLLQAGLHSLAQEHGFGAGLAVARDDLRIMSNPDAGVAELEGLGLRVLQEGWRRELVGEPLLRLREAKATVGFNAAAGRVRVL